MIITEHLTKARPTDADIEAFETSIQGALADDYKAFLNKENGGRPEPKHFRFTTKDGITEDGAVHYFYALYDGRVGSLKKSLERYKGRIALDYLPIGVDPFGNLILLHVSAQNPGKVYFWDHEKEEDGPALKNMTLIANSFSEFMEGLD